MSQSIMLSPYIHTAKRTSTQFETQQTQHPLILWFKHQQCLACCMLLLQGEMGWTVQLKKDVIMNLRVKKSHKEILTAEWRTLASRSHIALTREINICIPSSPTDCIRTHSPQRPDKPASSRNLNIIVSPKPKQDSGDIQWHVQSAQNFIAQNLNLQQKLFERNKSSKWKLEQEIHKI
jgi:hypothetical protein